MEIPISLKNEIWDYCRLNNITNIDEFIIKLVKQGFTSEKYGATPTTIEKIVEKIVEVPVEKIINISDNKEVEKISLKLSKVTDELKLVKKQLEDEQKKNKKDIYGE